MAGHGILAVQVAVLLGLAGCKTAMVPVETSLRLPTVTGSLPLVEPAEEPLPRIEIQLDGTVLLNDERVAKASDHELRELRSALVALLDVLPKIDDDWEAPTNAYPGMHAVPFLLLADGATPYSRVEEVLLVLQYRGIQVWDLWFTVQQPGNAHPSGLRVNLPTDIGISCGPGPALVTQLNWINAPAEGESEQTATLRISRTEIYNPRMETEPPPQYLEHEALHGDDLGLWLREPGRFHDGIEFEAQEGATWQDIITLLDHCLASDIDFVSGLHLHPTLDALSSAPPARNP